MGTIQFNWFCFMRINLKFEMEGNAERLENEDWVEKYMWMYKGQARPRRRPNETWLEVIILVGRGYEAIWSILF